MARQCFALRSNSEADCARQRDRVQTISGRVLGGSGCGNERLDARGVSYARLPHSYARYYKAVRKDAGEEEVLRRVV